MKSLTEFKKVNADLKKEMMRNVCGGSQTRVVGSGDNACGNPITDYQKWQDSGFGDGSGDWITYSRSHNMVC